MGNLPWLDEVRKRLAKHGLPPTYIRRFTEELADHLEDLKEENMSTEASVSTRLGEPEQVAKAAVVAYRRRSFVGRHPLATFLVFGVSPVVSLSGLFALVLVAVIVFFDACERLGVNPNVLRLEPAASGALAYLLSLLTICIPNILVSSFYCKLANRLGINRKWMLLSCAMLAVMAGIAMWSVTLSDEPGKSNLTFAVGISSDLPHVVSSIFCNSRQLLQFLVPLAMGLWFMRRNRDKGQLQLAS